MIGETFNWLVCRAFGLGTHKLQWPRRLLVKWRRFRGMNATVKIDVVDGYMYAVYEYGDDVRVHLRDPLK